MSATTSGARRDRLDVLSSHVAIERNIESAHSKDKVLQLVTVYPDLVADILHAMEIVLREPGERVTKANKSFAPHPLDWTADNIPEFATADYAARYSVEWRTQKIVPTRDENNQVVRQPPIFTRRLATRGVNWRAVKPLIQARTFASEWHNMGLKESVVLWFANHLAVYGGKPAAPLSDTGVSDKMATLVPAFVTNAAVSPGHTTNAFLIHPRDMEKLDQFVPSQAQLMNMLIGFSATPYTAEFQMSPAAANALFSLAFNAFVTAHVIPDDPQMHWSIDKVFDFVHLLYIGILKYANRRLRESRLDVGEIFHVRLARAKAQLIAFTIVMTTVMVHGYGRPLTLQSPTNWQEAVDEARLLAFSFRHTAIPRQR